MKQLLSIPKRFTVLPVVLATSLSLAGCGADSTGEINGGLDDGFGGGIGGTNSVLLAAGVVGLAAILADSSDSGSSSPTVGVESGEDIDDGTGDGGTGNGGENTVDGGTGDGGDGTGDGGENNNGGTDDGTGDGGENTNGGNDGGTGDGSENTDGGTDDGTENGTGVNAFEPPAWINGMWRGTSSSGEDRVAFATATDIGMGTSSALTGHSAIPGISVTELQNNDSVYEYTVSYPGPNGTVTFTETWTNNGDGTLLYSASGDINDEFIMYQAPASDFIAPPQWLQGDWEANDYRASVSAGNISLGPIGATATNLFDVVSAPGSIVRVVTNTGADYQLNITTTVDGAESTVDYHFGIFDDNSITFTSNLLKTTVVMIRQ